MLYHGMLDSVNHAGVAVGNAHEVVVGENLIDSCQCLRLIRRRGGVDYRTPQFDIRNIESGRLESVSQGRHAVAAYHISYYYLHVAKLRIRELCDKWTAGVNIIFAKNIFEDNYTGCFNKFFCNFVF